LQDSTPATIYVLPIGDLLRERFTSLMLGGESDVGGTSREGWLNNHHPFVMMNDAELTVEMEIPTPDTGVAAGEDLYYAFDIRNQKELTSPGSDPNLIVVRFFIEENGLIMQIYKRIASAYTLLWNGSTADGNSGADPAGDQFWIFRFVFHDGVAGATAPEDVRHMHVYAKHGASRAAAEAATEEQLTDTVGTQASPYDISDLLFTVGYLAYHIETAHTTWFGTTVGSQLEAISTYLKTSYPALFALKYDFVDASYGYGDVELWDTKGSAVEADWQQVFDEDHVFTGDAVLQNGLIRLHVDEGVIRGFELFYWSGAAWISLLDALYPYLRTDVTHARYPFLIRITQISPEKISIRVRWRDSAVENEDYYVDGDIVLERGHAHISIDWKEAFPAQSIELNYWSTGRWGYAGDANTHGIGDDDLSENALNTTLTDNFLLGFDDDGDAVIGWMSSNKKPTSSDKRFQAFGGGNLYISDFAYADIEDAITYHGYTIFPLIANLFEEAEDATISTAARSHLDGEGDCVDSVCEAHPDRVGGIDIDGDAFGFWTNVDDCVVSQETTYLLKMEATESSKIVVAGVPVGAWSFDHQYPGAQDWNAEDFIGFWWYGRSTGDTLHLTLQDTGAGAHTENFLDDFTGWRWIAFPKALFTAGGVNFVLIDYIEIGCAAPASSPGETYYCDFVNMYTVNTDTLWAATLNCTIDVSEDTEDSVGDYCVEITSSGAGWLNATCTPTNILAKLIKFDQVKLYLHRAGGAPATVHIFLIDSDGDSVSRSIAIDGVATEYPLSLPHSDADIQGWSETGTFRYDDLTELEIVWNAVGGGEIVYVDGIHFYIGTTTTRGRGETLSNGEAVVLDAQNEFVSLIMDPIEDYLPDGRYLFVIRAKDTDQVVNDLGMRAHNWTDSKNKNQSNEDYDDLTLTSSFDYYLKIFDIDSGDIADQVYLRTLKQLATENTIFFDYILIIPIGDGEDWPQDLAHAAMRTFTKPRRLYVR